MDGGKQGSFWRGTHWNGVPEPLCDYWQQSYCIASSQVEFKGGKQTNLLISTTKNMAKIHNPINYSGFKNVASFCVRF